MSDSLYRDNDLLQEVQQAARDDRQDSAGPEQAAQRQGGEPSRDPSARPQEHTQSREEPSRGR